MPFTEGTGRTSRRRRRLCLQSSGSTDAGTRTHGTYFGKVNNSGFCRLLESRDFRPLVLHGFLDTNGSFTTINDPLATGPTIAYGINDAGQVVGYYVDSTGSHGFLDTNGVFTTINDPAAGIGTEAYGINNAGQIVGAHNNSAG